MTARTEIESSGRRLIWVHLICWVLVLQLLFDFTGLYDSFTRLFLDGKPHVDEAFLLIPLMPALFYINSLYLLPTFLGKRKAIVLYIFSLIGSYALYVLIGLGLFILLKRIGLSFDYDLIGLFDLFLVSGLLVIGISTSVGLSRLMFESTRLKKKAQVEQKQAELNYLAAQVNPHFLFNTLNSIYALSTAEKAPKTTEAILKLSELMRYPIRVESKQTTTLEDEIQLIKDYIDLQKIRLGEDYPVHLNFNGKFDNRSIAPFLFISIIENAFKYGVSRKTPQPLYISLTLTHNQVEFSVRNSRVDSEQHLLKSEHFGLNNLRERLQLMYPDKHALKLTESNPFFLVNLTIDID